MVSSREIEPTENQYINKRLIFGIMPITTE